MDKICLSITVEALKALMNSRNLILGIFVSALMSGCIVYQPMTTDVPLISKKNDLRVDAGTSLIPSANATISYGLTDKIAIQGSGSIGVDDKYYVQAATGLYKNLGNSQIFELYSGFGYGHGEAYYDANPGYLIGNYQLYFAQANFGKIAHESSNFEIGIGLKTGYLHSNFTDQNYYDLYSDTEPYKVYQDESILLEPIGFVRVGGERLRFNVKLAGTAIFKLSNKDKDLPYIPLNIGLGINYRFCRK